MNLKIPSPQKHNYNTSQVLYSQCQPMVGHKKNNQITLPFTSSHQLIKSNKNLFKLQLMGSEQSTKRFIKDSDNSLRSKLTSIKQLWYEQPLINKVKSMLHHFKPPLPYTYQKAIIYYCESHQQIDHNFLPGTLMDAAKIFRQINQTVDPLKYAIKVCTDSHIMEMEKYIQQEDPQNSMINRKQYYILILNILIFLSKSDMPKQFFTLLKKHQNLPTNIKNQVDLLSAYIVNKHNKYQSQVSAQVKKAVRKHKNIINIDLFLEQIQKQQQCTVHEAFNIGLVLKKQQRFRQACLIFQKIKIISSEKFDQKLHILASINYAKCLFSLNLWQKAIQQLILLKQKPFVYPYLTEIKQKIQSWKKTLKFYQMTHQKFKNNGLKLNSSQLSLTCKSNILTNTCETDCQSSTYRLKSIENKPCWLLNKKIYTLHNQKQQLDKLKSFQKQSERKTFNTFRQAQKKYRIDKVSSKKYIYNKVNKYSKNTCSKFNLTEFPLSENKNKLKQSSDVPKIRVNLPEYPKSSLIDSQVKNALSLISSNQKTRLGHRFNQLRISDQGTDSSGPSILSFDSNQSFLSKLQSFHNNYDDQSEISSMQTPLNIQNDEEPNNVKIAKYLSLIRKISDKKQKSQIYDKLGQLYEDNQNYQMALNMFKNSAQSGNIQALYKIGSLYYSMKKYRDAIQFLQKYKNKSNQQDNQALIKLIYCYSKVSEFNNKSIQKAKQLLENDPGNSQVHCILVNLYQKQKNTNKAIELCIQFRKKYYYDADNHHLLGLLFKATKNNRQAYQCFLTALRIKPCSMKTLIQIVELTNSQHFYQQLLKIFQQALSKNDKNIEILQIIRLLIQKKCIKNQKIRENLTFPEFISYGDFFNTHNMVNQAQKCYLQAQKLSNNAIVRQKLGNICFQRGNYTQAERFYKQSQIRKPRASVQLKIAQIKLKQNKYQESRKIMKNWIDKQSSSMGSNLHNLGICEFNLGNFQAAFDIFKKSLNKGYQIEQNNKWIKKCLQRIHKNSAIELNYQKTKGKRISIIKKQYRRNSVVYNQPIPIEKLYKSKQDKGKYNQ